MKRVLEALPVLVIGIVVAAPSLSEVDRGATKKPAIRDGPRLGGREAQPIRTSRDLMLLTLVKAAASTIVPRETRYSPEALPKFDRDMGFQ
jgi:hypothetical protein